MICKYARSYLEPYCKVALTREDDTYLTLAERPQIANAINADLFVSKHLNSGPSPNTALSYEAFTTRGQNNSDEACEHWINRHGAMFPEKKLRADRRDGDADKEANFAVLRPTRCPSYLTEDEFIHTDHGAAFLKVESNLKKMGLATAQAIGDYLGFAVSSQTPLTSEARPYTLAEKVEEMWSHYLSVT